MPSPNKRMQLKNIGPIGEEMLKEIGIHGYDDLNRVGSVEAYRTLKGLYPGRISLNALYAMEAALWGIHWLELPTEVKDQLKAELLRTTKGLGSDLACIQRPD
jgi:DNA transformation protein